MASRKEESQVKSEGPKQEGNKQSPATGGHLHGGKGKQRGGRFGGFRNQGNMDRERMDDRRMRGPPRNGEGMGMGMGPRNQEDRVNERLAALSGPMYELPNLDMSEKKFAGRNRLYIGNLASDISEEELRDLFKPYGETSELFVNKEKNFGFIRLDYFVNAQKAKCELDGTIRKGRTLKIRFAPIGATLKVKNLTPLVTNELLYVAFAVFGEIERCVVIVDDRGKSTGEGIVEFARKQAASTALKRCNEGCYFVTSSLRPVIAEMYEQLDTIDGYPEKSLTKKNQEFHEAREMGPRFAAVGSFEFEYGTRWKQLYELYRQKEVALKQQLAMEEDKLEAQMQYAKFETETEMLREQLRVREMDRDRQKREWEERERIAEEQRIRNEEQMRRQQEDMQLRIHHQEEDLRRRQQENSLFMQAHQLTNMLDQQEQVIDSYGSPSEKRPADFDQAGSDAPPLDPKTFMNNYERGHRGGSGGAGSAGFDERAEMGGEMRSGGMGARAHMGGRSNWNERRDDYQNKRRRY